MDRRAIPLFHGLGDTITAVHAMNAFLRGTENYLIQCSYRPAFICPFVELVIPHLPKPVSFIRDEAFEQRWAVSFEEVALKYQAYYPGLHMLRIGRCPLIGELLTQDKFDFSKLVTASPLSQLGPYGVISVDVLKKDRVTGASDWLWASSWLKDRGFRCVIVGKKSPSIVDKRFGEDIQVDFPDEVIDLRDATDIQTTINIIANAAMVLSPVNAIAHLAWELKRPSVCLGAPSKKINYEELYFIGLNEQRHFRINYDRTLFRQECVLHLEAQH